MPNGSSDTDPCHRLYLIRHGETVDNVAGLYAGVRDSALTNHGAQQALRLGDYFAREGVQFTHIFSSDLTRAFKTAESIRAAQQFRKESTGRTLTVVQVPELREQDFGFYEGKPFHARSFDQTKSGKDQHSAQHGSEEGFQDIESKESMARRADRFLDASLFPLLHTATKEKSLTIAVVSHGMLLSSLWRCFIRRQPLKSITLHSSLLEKGGLLSLEHLGGWSNTGYLELQIRNGSWNENILQDTKDLATTITSHQPEDVVVQQSSLPSTGKNALESMSDVDAGDPIRMQGQEEVITEIAIKSNQGQTAELTEDGRSSFSTTIITVNGKEHLKSLKRTGGGVGSSKFDEGQKSIDSFFKRQRSDG